MPYTYRGNQIIIPADAEVAGMFRKSESPFGLVVQQALDQVEPWREGEDPIESFDLPRNIGARTVMLATTEKPVWGVNPHHTAQRPGISPFFELAPDDPRCLTNEATLELAGTVKNPILARVYPGDYMPPLPWMNSVRNEGACLEYWQDHAFVLRPQNMPAKLTGSPPSWYEQ